MYAALAARDASLDGVFVAAIRTTGIFCRPGCGARKPRRENVEFFDSPRAALAAGYRPCLRCRPMDAGSRPPEFVERALGWIEAAPDVRLTASEIRRRGGSPERLARYFKRQYGMTFQAYQRSRRVGRAVAPLRAGSVVRTAATAAGFESESGFREAFGRLFGSRPGQADRAARVVAMKWLETPLGPMLAGACDEGVCLLEFIDRRAIEAQIAALRRRLGASVALSPVAHPNLGNLERQLAEYFAGKRRSFSLRLHAPGTEFQMRVWDELQRIPHGQTRSYLDLARAIGRPTATRAVARANGDNRLAILIPCHRVIGADGSLSGYGGQVWRKQWLLDHESRQGLLGMPVVRPDDPASAPGSF